MKYDYTTYLPDERGKFIKRPMVEIEIFGKSASHKELALIDSGADRSLFHKEIAEILGVDLSRAEKRNITGISGAMEARTAEIKIRISHLNDAVTIPVDFADSPYIGALLGQEGFFDFHRIKFEKDHNIFEINPVREK